MKDAAARLGVSYEACRQWEKKGWVVRYTDRSVDFDATVVRVNSLRDPTRGGKQDRGIAAIPVPYESGAETPDSPCIDNQPDPDACVDGQSACISCGDIAEEDTLDVDDEQSIPAADRFITLQEARRRKEYWQAVRAELEAKKMGGELVSLENARKVYVDSITAAKASLEAVPQRVAPQVAGLDSIKDIRLILAKEIESALKTVAGEPL